MPLPPTGVSRCRRSLASAPRRSGGTREKPDVCWPAYDAAQADRVGDHLGCPVDAVPGERAMWPAGPRPARQRVHRRGIGRRPLHGRLVASGGPGRPGAQHRAAAVCSPAMGSSPQRQAGLQRPPPLSCARRGGRQRAHERSRRLVRTGYRQVVPDAADRGPRLECRVRRAGPT